MRLSSDALDLESRWARVPKQTALEFWIIACAEGVAWMASQATGWWMEYWGWPLGSILTVTVPVGRSGSICMPFVFKPSWANLVRV